MVDRVASAVTGCPAVARLAAGPLATHLPGRTVPGVALRGQTVRVAVVIWYGVSLPQAAAQVRTAVLAVAPGWQVDVAVEDIEVDAAAGNGGGASERMARDG